MRAWRIGAFCVAGLALFLVAGAVAFGPLVRARVAREATDRGLVIEYGSARPELGAIELRDVTVGLEGTRRLGARFDSIVLRFAFPVRLDGVEVRGGELSATGDLDSSRGAVSEGRSTRPPPAARGGATTRTPVRLNGIGAVWRADDGSLTGEAHGVSVVRDAELSFAADSVDGALGAFKVSASGARVELAPDSALRSARLQGLVLGWTPPEDEGPKAAPADDEPPPDPDPATVRKRVSVPLTRRGAKGALAAAVAAAATPATLADEASAAAPLLALPDLRAVRDRAVAAATRLCTKLPDGASVEVDGLSLAIGGKRPLTLGPGPVRVVHSADALDVDFRSPSAGEGVTPPSAAASPAAGGAAASSTALTLHASIPLAGGNITVSFSGGPLSLAALGIHDGAAGLLETGRTSLEAEGRLVLDADARELAFDGGLHLEDLSLQDARLAEAPVHHLELGMRARGVLTTDGRLKLAEGSLDVGAIKLRLHGEIAQDREAGAHTAANLSFDVPVAACQAMLSSVPAALLPTVGSSHMTGTFGATGTLSFDTQRLEDLKLDYHVDDGCHLDAVPRDLAPDRFSHAFLHRVYGPDGEVREEETGPGTPTWVDLENISPFMQVAVLTTEDGSFPHSHGFNHLAIKNAIIANLKARRFVRGASTITMQLAKNLFLTREKTLSRKLEEVILTDYLEQIFQKDQMMELYLNIIEFGPDVYGVEQAAEHYFGRRPEELDLAESLFLSSIMPSPIRYSKMAERGTLSEGWSHHLQTLMRVALRAGTITPAELEEGMKEQVVFHRPGTPPPPPREPVTAARLHTPGEGADEAWDYVQ
jgi:hypothetical protein